MSVYSTDVMIGNAVTDKRDYVRQVEIQRWYCNDGNAAWTAVARPKDTSIAAIIAAQMIYACNNNHIVYSKAKRAEVYNAIKSGILMQNIDTESHCDCTSLVTACLLAAGIDLKPLVGDIPYSGNIVTALKKSEQFDIFGDVAHTHAASGLLLGDILIRRSDSNGDGKEDGHAAIVVYSAYDKNTPEYKDVPLKDRTINYGRECIKNEYVCDGILLPRSETPKDLNELSDIELFLLGVSITGNEGAFIDTTNINKGVVSVRNL